jgi:hypothetical protein
MRCGSLDGDRDVIGPYVSRFNSLNFTELAVDFTAYSTAYLHAETPRNSKVA